MKELTGGDTIQARGLHKDPIEFKPQFKLIMTCNQLPEINNMDGGVERRLRVVEFKSKFVQDPDPDKPNEFLMDTDLNEKMEQWPEIFMKMLLDKYILYKTEGNKDPPEVLVATKDYKKECDIFNQFIDDMVEENPDAKIKLGQLYTVFKMWYGKCGTSKKVPRRNELKNAMNKRFGEYNMCWNGIRIKKPSYNNDDEEEDW